jgi:large subunit ribosomal protein L13
MKTLFPKKELHIPKWFILDARGKTLGRLATQASKLLRGKEISHYTPGVDLGNYVIIIHANEIKVTGKKEKQKLYYRNSQTPGNLKIETFENLKKRIPTRILEKAIWGMLPKRVLGRQYYRRLYVYAENPIFDKKNKTSKIENDSIDKGISIEKVLNNTNHWIEINL